jgi:5'-3' exonuclease
MGLLTNFIKPTVIIDSSYLTYYRLHATHAWYKREFKHNLPYHKDECINYDFSLDEEYVSAYSANFTKNILEIVAKNKTSLQGAILAKDCSRRNIWRKSIFPDYKGNRDKQKKGYQPNFGSMFNYTRNILLPKLTEKYQLKSLLIDGAEGDDIIAVLSKYLTEEKDEQVLVIANDMDISQIANDKIKIISLQEEDINLKVNTKFGSPSRMLLHKTLSGDSGDNIPNIKSGKMGSVTAMKCLDDPNILREFFRTYPESIEQFKLNKILVNFDFIPSDLQSLILKEYKQTQSNDLLSL